MPTNIDTLISSYDKPIQIIKRTSISETGYGETFSEEIIHKTKANIYIQSGNMAYSEVPGTSVQLTAKITMRDFSRSKELNYECLIVNGLNKYKPIHIERDKNKIKIMSIAWVEE